MAVYGGQGRRCAPIRICYQSAALPIVVRVRNFPGKSALRPWVLAARRTRRGDLRLADLAYGYPSFSQFGEDRAIEQLFADRAGPGFYVDVGAFHPYGGSNTYLLYRRGWRGINIEPVPALCAEIRKRRPRDLTLQLAVADTPGTAEFLSNGSFSGLADEHHLGGLEGERIIVETRTLADVLAQYLPADQPVDVLDVDCEGHDLVVLQSNDWSRFRPRVILAEWFQGTEIPDYLSGLDYELNARMRVTGIFTDRQP
jgi:FkbM family methyltransferase